MNRRVDTPRLAKLTLKRESLRELTAEAMRGAGGGWGPSAACPLTEQIYCIQTVNVGVTCLCN